MGEKRKEELGERRKGEKSKEGNIGKGRMVATCLVGLAPSEPLPKSRPWLLRHGKKLLFRQLAMVFVLLEMKKCAIFTLWVLYCPYYLYFYLYLSLPIHTSILLDRSPAFLTSDYFVRSNEIVRTKQPIY